MFLISLGKYGSCATCSTGGTNTAPYWYLTTCIAGRFSGVNCADCAPGVINWYESFCVHSFSIHYRYSIPSSSGTSYVPLPVILSPPPLPPFSLHCNLGSRTTSLTVAPIISSTYAIDGSNGAITDAIPSTSIIYVSRTGRCVSGGLLSVSAAFPLSSILHWSFSGYTEGTGSITTMPHIGGLFYSCN